MIKKPKAPKHFNAELKAWYEFYTSEFDMDPANCRILEMMGDAWQEYVSLRSALAAAKSHTFQDRFDSPKPRPELAAMNTCRITYARLRRELNLPIEEEEIRILRMTRKFA